LSKTWRPGEELSRIPKEQRTPQGQQGNYIVAEIQLRSADGNDAVSLSIRETTLAAATDRRFVLDSRFKGTSYSRLSSLDDNQIDGKIVEDYDIRLPQIMSTFELLCDLRDALARWAQSQKLCHVTIGTQMNSNSRFH
jgi:hypothetical protein